VKSRHAGNRVTSEPPDKQRGPWSVEQGLHQPHPSHVGNDMQRVKILGFLLVQQDPTQL